MNFDNYQEFKQWLQERCAGLHFVDTGIYFEENYSYFIVRCKNKAFEVQVRNIVGDELQDLITEDEADA